MPDDPSQDDFLSSLGGLLDDPLSEDKASESTPAAPEPEDIQLGEEDPFALPELSALRPARPARPEPQAADAGVSDDFFDLPALPGQLPTRPTSASDVPGEPGAAVPAESVPAAELIAPSDIGESEVREDVPGPRAAESAPAPESETPDFDLDFFGELPLAPAPAITESAAPAELVQEEESVVEAAPVVEGPPQAEGMPEPEETSPVRAMYTRLAADYRAMPAVPDHGGGVQGDRFPLEDMPTLEESSDFEMSPGDEEPFATPLELAEAEALTAETAEPAEIEEVKPSGDDLDDVFAWPEPVEIPASVPEPTETSASVFDEAPGTDSAAALPEKSKSEALSQSADAAAQDLGLSETERAALDSEFARSERARRAGAGEEIEEATANEEEDPFALEALPLATPSATEDLLASVDEVEPEVAEPAAPKESLPERLNADLNLGEHETVPEDLSLPSFQHETSVAPPADEGPLVIRRRIVEQAKKSVAPGASRFPMLAGVREAAYQLWNGPLGWKADPDNAGYVAAKAFLRLGLAFVVPVVLALLVFGLPHLGSAYPAQAFDTSTSTLRWGRGLVELPAPFTIVELPEGGQLPSTTVPILTHLYGSFFTEFDTAVASGDTTVLDALLSADMAARLNAEVQTLFAAGQHRELYGYGFSADNLVLRSGVPGTDPTEVRASVLGPTTAYIVDANGNDVSSQPYSSFDAVFTRQADGSWHIDELVFNLQLD